MCVGKEALAVFCFLPPVATIGTFTAYFMKIAICSMYFFLCVSCVPMTMSEYQSLTTSFLIIQHDLDYRLLAKGHQAKLQSARSCLCEPRPGRDWHSGTFGNPHYSTHARRQRLDDQEYERAMTLQEEGQTVQS